MKKKVIYIIGIIVITIVLVCFIWTTWGNPSVYMSYPNFVENMENGAIEKVVLEDKNVKFWIIGKEKTYYTDHPQSDGFKESLLLKGIHVEIVSTEETLNLMFNLIFYLFFFAAVGLGVYKLTEINRTTFKIVKKTNVQFSDIAGMGNLKREMMQIVDIFKDSSREGVRPIKGIILEGPPGNGKTLFAKALANEANVNFIATKGADFQSAMMSMGANKIKMLFKKASRHKPCIIFIDEFDGIGERRNYTGTGVDKENNRIITAMLNEMDGFKPNDGILVIAATNSYASLDAALIRPGRFDLKFNVPNPDIETRLELIRIYTKGKVLAEEINVQKLAQSFENISCAGIEAVLNEAEILSKLGNNEKISLQNILDAGVRIGVRIDTKKLR